jgi:hypothetical protein
MKAVGKTSWPVLASAILFVAVPQVNADLIINGNFATVTPALPLNGICITIAASIYPQCSATGWTGYYQIGNGATIGIGGSSFNIPQPDPGGSSQALILQSYPSLTQPTATQSFNVPITGLYTLTFFAANRYSPSYANTSGPQTLTVSLDGATIAGGIYTALPTSWTLETLNFTAIAGINSLTFAGLATSSTDVSAFVDAVSLVPQSTPEPSSFVLLLMALTTGVVIRNATKKSGGS